MSVDQIGQRVWVVFITLFCIGAIFVDPYKDGPGARFSYLTSGALWALSIFELFGDDKHTTNGDREQSDPPIR
ncbi:MAG: hypothetical protein JXA89_11815 [Anaerolineae bacterium]|nr:hypothetical protein [Anaerolineae bacterium]